MTDSNINTLEVSNDFADIQPYNDHQFKEKIEKGEMDIILSLYSLLAKLTN